MSAIKKTIAFHMSSQIVQTDMKSDEYKSVVIMF